MPIGIINIEGDFLRGETVSISSIERRILALDLLTSCRRVKRIMGCKSQKSRVFS